MRIGRKQLSVLRDAVKESLYSHLCKADAYDYIGPFEVLDCRVVEEFTCKYCGARSEIDPSDQTPPPDYCHPEDHRSIY